MVCQVAQQGSAVRFIYSKKQLGIEPPSLSSLQTLHSKPDVYFPVDIPAFPYCISLSRHTRCVITFCFLLAAPKCRKASRVRKLTMLSIYQSSSVTKKKNFPLTASKTLQLSLPGYIIRSDSDTVSAGSSVNIFHFHNFLLVNNTNFV